MGVAAAEAAQHIYLSPSRFRDLLSIGAITRQPSRGYDIDVVRREYISHLQKTAQGRGTDSAGLSKQRAELESARTKSVLAKTAILTGDYASMDTMARVVERHYAVIRERVLSIAGKTADAVASLTGLGRDETFQIIDAEARDALSELSEGTFVSDMRAARPAAGRRRRADGQGAAT